MFGNVMRCPLRPRARLSASSATSRSTRRAQTSASFKDQAFTGHRGAQLGSVSDFDAFFFSG